MTAQNAPTPRWRRLYNWVDWWSQLAPAVTLTAAEHALITEHLRVMAPKSRQLLTGIWERQNEQLNQDLESVRGRGAALLTATGVVSGVLTLLIPVVALVHIGWNTTSLFDDVLLI